MKDDANIDAKLSIQTYFDTYGRMLSYKKEQHLLKMRSKYLTEDLFPSGGTGRKEILDAIDTILVRYYKTDIILTQRDVKFKVYADDIQT